MKYADLERPRLKQIMDKISNSNLPQPDRVLLENLTEFLDSHVKEYIVQLHELLREYSPGTPMVNTIKIVNMMAKRPDEFFDIHDSRKEQFLADYADLCATSFLFPKELYSKNLTRNLTLEDRRFIEETFNIPQEEQPSA